MTARINGVHNKTTSACQDLLSGASRLESGGGRWCLMRQKVKKLFKLALKRAPNSPETSSTSSPARQNQRYTQQDHQCMARPPQWCPPATIAAAVSAWSAKKCKIGQISPHARPKARTTHLRPTQSPPVIARINNWPSNAP